MCQVVANKMLQVLGSCTLYPKAKGQFEKSASRGDCDAIWNYYNQIVKQRPDVGRGIQRSGGKPVESVRREIEQLYVEHQGNSKTRSR